MRIAMTANPQPVSSVRGSLLSMIEANEHVVLPPAQLLQLVLDSLVDGVIAVDATGHVVATNARIADMIDVPPGGVRPGIAFLDVLLARARAGAFGSGDPAVQADERLAAKLQPGGSPQRSIGKGGRILEFRRGDLPDGGFVAIYTDVTERARLEQEERRAEQRLREIVEANPLPMTITMMADGRVVYANQRAADMMRTSLDHLVGARSVDFYADPADRDEVVRRLRDGGFVDAMETRFRRPDGGDEFWLALTCRPIVYGGQQAIVTGFHDLTERRHSMLELARRTEMLDAIAFAATRIVASGNWQDGIQDLLSHLGVAANVDRVTLFEMHGTPQGQLVESCRYDWAAPELAPLSGDSRYHNIPLVDEEGKVDEWAQSRLRGEVVQAMLHELDGYNRQVFLEHGTLSFISVPIMLRSGCWGFLGFDDCKTERVWTKLEIDVLQTAAALVAGALERTRIDEQLRLSEQRYALAARGANDGLWDWDMPTDRAYYSPRLHEIFGLHDGQLGQSPTALLDRVVPADRERVLEYLQSRFARQRRKFAFEARVEHATAGERWTAWRGLIVYEDGRPLRVVGSLHDITERKAAEATLREREERLRTLTDDAPVLLSMIDPQDRLIFANSRFLEFFGRSLADLSNGKWDWAQDIHPDDLAEVERIYFDALERQQSVEIEHRVRRFDGEYRWVRETHVARFGPDGQFAGFVGALVDITDRKRAEAELARQREALYQSEKLTALGSLLAGVAHELNNPLSIVVGQAQMLQDAAADPKTTARAEKIRQAAERCSRIVRTFLALARQRPRELAPVQLNSVVEMAVDLLGYQLRTADIAVTLDLAGSLPTVLADADQLNQVVTNLVINAQQALIAAKSPRQLRIATRDTGDGRLRLIVADNGPGVPAHIRSRIFEPFFTTKSPGSGTGIGLSMCLSIVTTHGGSVSVEETPGGGATFIVALPVRTAPATPAEASSEPRPLTARKRILVVDDEPEIVDTLADILRSVGHLVETAENGRRALDRLAGGAFDLVPSGLRMPGLDGPALYGEIRTHHPAMLGRIAFITGDMLSSQLREFLALTGVPCLEKPFNADDVRTLVARLG